MVLKREFNLEDIITKNGMRILRLMIKRPYLSYGLSELSSSLGVSKSNVLGYLRVLQKNNLIRTEKEGKKKTYKINSSLEIMQLLWLLFMNEKKNNLRPASKNTVEYIFEKVKDKAEVFILFGSVAYGLEQEGSDIDILVVGDVVLPELASIIRTEESKRNKEINYTVMSRDEFDFRKKRRDPFLLGILSESRFMIIGNEEDLVN